MFQNELEDEEGRNNIFITEFQERKQVDVTALASKETKWPPICTL